MSTQVDVAAHVKAVIARVNAACDLSGRSPHDVAVLIASKTQPLSAIAGALTSFCAERASRTLPPWAVEQQPQAAAVETPRVLVGENRVQELVSKEPALSRLLAPYGSELHFIGSLQKNKINQLLACPVTCVQTVDSIELAQALSHRCERIGRTLDVMVQVNVSGEASKAGCSPDDAAELANQVAALPALRLTGFMTIGTRPAIHDGEITNADQIRAGYRQLREIRDAVSNSGNPSTAGATELSMGMSTDLELAIAEGATVVRIGTAIFGQRT